RLLFVLAVAFLVTYQAYYLLEKVGSTEAEVPQQIFLGTLAQSAVLIAAALTGGRLSDRTGRRKIFVFSASIVYGLALFVVAIASNFNGFLVGMAISGLGFGVYFAVDLALVVDVHEVDRKSTRLNSSHDQISYAVFCLKKKITSNIRAAILAFILLLLAHRTTLP